MLKREKTGEVLFVIIGEMKVIQESLEIQTKGLLDFVRVDGELQKKVKDSGIKNGFVLIRVPHTTAGLVVTERDPAVHQDFKMVLEKMISAKQDWQHSYEGEINARAHQASMLLGKSCWLPIKDGKIVLGTWEGVFLVELFEERGRRIEMVVVGK